MNSSKSITGIAFIENELSLNINWKILLEMGFSNLMIISENILNIKNPFHNVKIEYRLLSDFRYNDLDIKVKNIMDIKFNELIRSNPGMAAIMEKYCGLQTIKYSLWSWWFKIYRKLLLIKHITNFSNFQIVLCDNYWETYCKLAGIKSILVSDKKQYSSKKQLALNRINDFYIIVKEGIGRILFPILYCMLTGEKEYQQSNIRLLLIGSEVNIKSFSGIWKIIKSTENNADVIEFFDREILFYRKNKKKNRYIESIAGIKDGLQCIKKFWKLATAIRKSSGNFNFGFDPEKNSYFFKETRKFLYSSSASMILYARIADLLSESHPNLKRIIICTFSPQSRVLSHILEKYNIHSIFTTHGMVLEPIGYLSDCKFTLTWGEFDSKLLRKYNGYTEFLSLWGTGNSIEDEMSPQNNERSLQANNVFYWYPGHQEYAQRNLSLDGNLGLIFPTSNLKVEIIRHFLEMGFNFFEQYSKKHKISCIVIKLKKRPSTKLDVYTQYVSKKFKEGFGIPVLISESLNICPLIKMCSFGLCYISSIMLDFIKYKVPFAVINGNSMSDREFLGKFPNWMIIKNKNNIISLLDRDETEFNNALEKLKEIYWGEDTDNKIYKVHLINKLIS